MSLLQNMISSAGMAFGLMLYFWIVPLLLTIFLFINIAFSFSRGYKLNLQHLLILFPITLSPLILFFGVILSVPPNSQNPTIGISSIVIQAIFFLQILTGCWFIYKSKGYRWTSACLIGLELYFGYFCLIIAGMMVTGIWL
jgi:hypothetical protein